MPMLKLNNHKSNYFQSNNNEKFRLDKQNIKKDQKDFVGKSLDNKRRIKKSLLRHIPQNKGFINKLLLFLKEISFGK